MAGTEKQQCRLVVGDLVMDLNCYPPALADVLANWFIQEASDRPADLDLDLELVAHEDIPELPNSLLANKLVGSDGSFDVAGGLITGCLDRTGARGSIRPKATLARGRLLRILEQIFYQAFHSANTLRGGDACLVHSSAVIADGAGFLFVGPSGAGKSTVAQLSTNHHVLGDEMQLLAPEGEGFTVRSTPFNGTFRSKLPGQAPLRAIFILEQADAHRLTAIGPAEAASALAAEIVPPVGLDELPTPDTLPAMVEYAARILEYTPVWRLEFLPDPGFWEILATEFNLEIGDGPGDRSDQP